MQKLWNIEDIIEKPKFSNDEVECERHIQEITMRQNNGRFTVKIPMKESREKSRGESKNTALKRLFSLEKKFKINVD